MKPIKVCKSHYNLNCNRNIGNFSLSGLCILRLSPIYLQFILHFRISYIRLKVLSLFLLFHGAGVCLWTAFRSCEDALFFLFTERLRVPSGPINGGFNAGSVLHHGPAVVCGRHCPLHHSRQQPETGIRMFSSRRTTQISWHSGAKGYGAFDFYSYGFISLYDQHSEGNEICLYESERRQNMFITV